MIKELLYKWFNLEPTPCAACEVLRTQLEKSEHERKELLDKLLSKDEPKSVPQTEDFKPILPRFTPWSVRRHMLEAEDRNKAKLLAEKQAELSPSIANLEEELKIVQEKING